MKSSEFELLKNIMANAFSIETNYYEMPSQENIHIPREIMNIIPMRSISVIKWLFWKVTESKSFQVNMTR